MAHIKLLCVAAIGILAIVASAKRSSVLPLASAKLNYARLPQEIENNLEAKRIPIYLCNDNICSGGKQAILVTKKFALALNKEGQGILPNGRVIFKYKQCRLPFNCFGILDPKKFPFGRSDDEKRPLIPYISLFANKLGAMQLTQGDTVIANQLIGLQIPGTKIKHNGCLVVDRCRRVSKESSASLLVSNCSNEAFNILFEQQNKISVEKATCEPIQYSPDRNSEACFNLPIPSDYSEEYSDENDIHSDEENSEQASVDESDNEINSYIEVDESVSEEESDNYNVESEDESSNGEQISGEDSDDSSEMDPAIIPPNESVIEVPKEPNEECIQEENCHMPDCRCFTFDAPKKLERNQIPFFITLTWDDVNTASDISNIVARLERNVPRDAGGCHARATYFVSWHHNGNLQDIVSLKRLANAGNKIAFHTFWHNTNQNSTSEEWQYQYDASQYASKLAGVEMNGSRAPYTYWNENYLKMMAKWKIGFDSSFIMNTYPQHQQYVWPHTLNWGPHQWVKDIAGWFNPMGNLSTPSPGVWEHYMTEILAAGSLTQSLGTSMEPPVTSADEVYNTLQWNFELHYNSTNRAPFGIYWHLSSIGSWNPNLLEGLERFLTNVVKEHSDVYFATVPEIISWVKNPVPLGEFQGFGCANDASVLDDPCDGQGSVVCRANLPNPIPPGVTQPIAQEYSVCGTECPDWTLGSVY